jgi:NADH-quinone oxidoreductase subunit N
MGNFSALRQQNVKRMMAYSSIAQTGFLLVGLATFSIQGAKFIMFYAAIYLFMNYLVFIYLQYFEKQGFQTMSDYNGTGKRALVPHLFLLIGFISLTGLPPTAGFMAKLFIFSGLWESYAEEGKQVLLWLLVFGLINTVISLFYYLRIPFLAFLKQGNGDVIKYPTWTNFLGLILVFIVLFLFFQPNVLMSWINKINFAL